MRIAAIDIGTNSVHMIVVQVRPDLSFEVIDREKDMVRLGAGGLDGKSLTPTALTAALQTLAKFKRIAESHKVDEIVAAATSATREADNGGGSVEVTIGTATHLTLGRSFKVGVSRLTERFVHSDPLSRHDLRRLVKHLN